MTFTACFLYFIDDLALLCLALLLWIPFYWVVFHSGIQFWRRLGNRAFWVALPVWVAFGLGLVAARQHIFAQRLPRSLFTWATGAVLLAVVVWLDAQTRHAFGWRRLVGLTELNQRHRLCGVVRAGIYGRVRHPRYLLYMLAVLSMAFLTGARIIFLLAFLNILMYQILAPLEERELLDQYGPQYEDYRRSVPRFLPRLSRTPAAPSPS